MGWFFYHLFRLLKHVGCENLILKLIYRSKVLNWTSDAWYWKLTTLIYAGEEYKLPGHGGGINSVIRWQQMHWKSDLPEKCSDKILVREFVKERVGEKYLIPQLPAEGVSWSSPEEIDIAKLPQSFVLKLNNGSGMNHIVPNKTALDWNCCKRVMARWLTSDFSSKLRERHYSGIVNRLYCEAFISDAKGQPPMDYKVMCSNGHPLYAWVDVDRFSDHKRNVYSIDWIKQDVSIGFAHADIEVPRPQNWEEMLDVAGKLSAGIPIVRIDLYNVDGRIYFGEMTFTPGAGYIDKVTPLSFSIAQAAKIDLAPFMKGRK